MGNVDSGEAASRAAAVQADVSAGFAECGPKDWAYIAEGALNLVLRYVGEDPRLRGIVLRVRKANPKASGGADAENPWPASAHFVDTFVVPLLGRRYVQRNTQVPLRDGFMAELGAQIENSRPEKRRVHPLDCRLKVGLLMINNAEIPSNVDSPSFCFELKLKCGFIPRSACVTKEIKLRKDRFTLHQQFKYSKGDLNTLSRYSPYDLFSYDKIRVRGALEEMVANPQNNFRLFVDGEMCYPDHHGHGSRPIFDQILQRYPKIYERNGVTGMLDTLAQIVCAEPLLDRIKRFQMLDDCDIEGAYACYQAILARGDTVEPISGLTEAILPRAVPTKTPAEMTPDEQQDTVQRFLLSCTAKDCSVMIVMKPTDTGTLRPIPSFRQSALKLVAPRTIVEAHGYEYSIAAVDLDPKPLAKMQHWYDLDQEIAELNTTLEAQGKLV